MKSPRYDDLIPEEEPSARPDLVPLLRQVYQQSAPLSDREQEQMMARVRERLLRADLGPAPDQEQAVHLAEEAEGPPLQPVPAPTVPRRAGVLRFSNALAAVLVVGALIGASLLLFRHAPGSSFVTQSPPGPAPHSTNVLIQAEHGGLEAALRLTGGPYFLSETLAVDMTLTNHTSTTWTLVGFPEDDPCGAVLTLDMISAQPPTFPPPPHVFIPCPFGSHPLEAGQTLTIHHYETLTASGQVTLTEGAGFMTTQTDATGTQSTPTGPGPLDGYWPSVTIEVFAQVPQAARFSFTQEGARVVVTAPAGAQPHLLYRYVVRCQDAQGPGSTEILQTLWQPLATTTVHEPGCPGIHSQWAFAFSAPGYATVAGSACVVRQEVNC